MSTLHGLKAMLAALLTSLNNSPFLLAEIVSYAWMHLSTIVLLIDLLLLLLIFKTRRKMKWYVVVALGLGATCIAAFLTLSSKYALDLAHVLSHSVYSMILLVCARLLLTEKTLAVFHRFSSLELDVFDRFQYFLAREAISFFEWIRDFLEVDVFDRFQYFLAREAISLSYTIRKTQTGNLNFNMVGVLVGVIIFLILLSSSR